MGHTRHDMASVYRERLSDERLRAVQHPNRVVQLSTSTKTTSYPEMRVD
jgi:hypothetical protein